MPKQKKHKEKSKRDAVVPSPRPAGIEDLRPGDFVAVESEDAQLPPFCDESARWPRHALRLSYVPYDAGKPRRVVRISPPFVLVCEPDGQHDTFDLRLTRLLKLDRTYGRLAFRRMDPQRTHRRERRKRKR